MSLGVDINDVWMVATASERNLTVLTQDKMACIREAALRLSLNADLVEYDAALHAVMREVDTRA